MYPAWPLGFSHPRRAFPTPSGTYNKGLCQNPSILASYSSINSNCHRVARATLNMRTLPNCGTCEPGASDQRKTPTPSTVQWYLLECTLFKRGPSLSARPSFLPLFFSRVCAPFFALFFKCKECSTTRQNHECKNLFKSTNALIGKDTS